MAVARWENNEALRMVLEVTAIQNYNKTISVSSFMEEKMQRGQDDI